MKRKKHEITAQEVRACIVAGIASGHRNLIASAHGAGGSKTLEMCVLTVKESDVTFLVNGLDYDNLEAAVAAYNEAPGP